MLEDFRSGLFNVLVATSIGEEGLDIPRVDLVIFFEPVPSAIRSIQRRGRTGRQEKGRVIILMAKGTRDEVYKFVAQNREKTMYRNLANIKRSLVLTSIDRKEAPLSRFTEEKIKIYADYREKGSGVVKDLAEKGVVVHQEMLIYADYIVSSRCGIEIKTISDFVNSIVDGRLLSQIKSLKEQFERPLLILEGEEDIYSVRNVHQNSILGMLATITVSFGVPVVQTRNYKETSSLIYMIAKREQEETSKDFSPHGSRKPSSLKEQQEYVVSSFPAIGMGLARPLLSHFKSVRGIVNAPIDELKKVEKIGPSKAKQLRDMFDSEYKN